MRFKRLRLMVGIAILLFVLIIGNILAFSVMHDEPQNQNNVAIVDVRKNESNLVIQDTTPISTASSTPSGGQNTANNDALASDSSKVTPPVTTTIVHTTRRTRAS